MPARTRPIEKFGQAVAKCSTEVRIPVLCRSHANLLPQLSVYGKCIVVDYNAVHKDKCLTEFLRLKDCYIVRCMNAYGDELLTLYRLRRRKADELGVSPTTYL